MKPRQLANRATAGLLGLAIAAALSVAGVNTARALAAPSLEAAR